jgi:NAD(P)-dependent dehydrogenase (short-subunit alcohol dehydrogenase family)
MERVAIITGASRGIGRGIALELAALGWNLVLNYRSNEEAAREAADLCLQRRPGAKVELVQGDISSASDRARLIQAARARFSKLDLLVNNAGIAPRQRVDMLELSEESFDELLAVNLKAPFFLSQLAARWMLESPASPSRGRIVTVSSISAYTASVQRADYCIAKAGLAMLTKLFAARLAGDGINVYEIRPGVIETDMTSVVKGKYDALIAGGLTPIQRWGQPSDVARAVSAIAQDLLPFSTGEVINVDGGFHLHRL